MKSKRSKRRLHNSMLLTEETIRPSGYQRLYKEISYNRAKHLLELKHQVEKNPKNANKKHIEMLKRYEWAIGKLNIKQEEENKLIGGVFSWKSRNNLIRCV